MSTTRTRTRSSIIPSRYYYDWTGNWAPYSGHEIRGNGWVGKAETMKDNSTPGFKKLAKQGLIVMSDCELSRVERSFTPGATTSNSANYSGSQHGDMAELILGNPVMSLPSLVTASEMSLLMQLYADVNKGSLMTGEFLSDMGKTVGMLTHPFKSASKLAWKMAEYSRRNAKKTAASAILAANNSWLEYRYGWSPIIHDVQTVIKEAHNVRERGRRCQVARAGNSDSFSKTQTWAGTGPTTSVSGSLTVAKKAKCDVGVIFESCAQSSSDSLNSILGLRLRDVPATAWEVIPYSFVVDWFLPIGTWIQAITPVPGVTIKGTWITKTTLTETQRSGQIDYSWNKGWQDPAAWKGSFGSEKITDFSYTRITNPILAFTPKFEFARINNAYRNMLHIIDACAISSGQLNRQLGELRVIDNRVERLKLFHYR